MKCFDTIYKIEHKNTAKKILDLNFFKKKFALFGTKALPLCFYKVTVK